MSCSIRFLSVAAVVAGLVALPASSFGATARTVVSGQKHWVLYDAAPGEANHLLVEVATRSRTVRFTDTAASITPGPGCSTAPENRVLCQIPTRVRLVQIDLADSDDRADAETPNAGAAQINIVGGNGKDLLRGHGPSRFNFNGNDGNDQLVGSDGPDVLRGEVGDDYLSGGSGDDFLIGDAGGDTLRGRLGLDRLFGGPDSDKLDARDQPTAAPDRVVSCGDDRDIATVDRVDMPKTTGCEVIRG